MNTEVTKDEVEQYRRDGFLLKRSFLSPEEVDDLKSGVLEAISEMGNRKLLGRDDFNSGDGYYDNVFTQRLNLWRHNETVKRYVLNPELGRLISALEGVDGFRVWHDQALIKEPFGNPTAWHLDNPYWSFRSPHSLSIWIALEDATLENGCMWFAPGSHKLANYDKVAGIGMNQGDLFKLFPQMAEVDPVGVPMKAGDCSFHNGLTGHGAGANMTRGRRIAMTCAFMPIGCTYNGNPNVLPREYHETLAVGDVLENDDWNPIVWQA